MMDNQIDIGEEVVRGWNLFKANIQLLVLAALFGGVLSLMTCMVLAGPMSAGFFLIARRLLRNDPIKPQVGDVFKGLDYFLPSFLLFVVTVLAMMVLTAFLRVVPLIGSLIGFALSFVLESAFMWAMMFVVFERMSAMDAIKRLINGISSGDLLMPLGFGLLMSLMNRAGAMVCGIGLLVTAPLAYCCLVCAYETLFGGDVGERQIEADAVQPPDLASL